MKTLDISIEPKGWNAPRGSRWNHNRGIEHLVRAAADPLWAQCPRTHLDPLVVYHREDHPQADLSRDAEGHIRVGLQASGTEWARFAFQFAHEFCHVLAGQSNDAGKIWRSLEHPNFWLEETLCETASYFVLRHLAHHWQSPAEWPYEPIHFGTYAAGRMSEPLRKLPPDESFAEWFRHEEHFLRAHPAFGAREKNCIVAAQLLPLLEARPQGWESVTFLNLGKPANDQSLEEHFSEWKHGCPGDLQDFVASVAALFGLKV